MRGRGCRSVPSGAATRSLRQHSTPLPVALALPPALTLRNILKAKMPFNPTKTAFPITVPTKSWHMVLPKKINNSENHFKRKKVMPGIWHENTLITRICQLVLRVPPSRRARGTTGKNTQILPRSHNGRPRQENSTWTKSSLPPPQGSCPSPHRHVLP